MGFLFLTVIVILGSGMPMEASGAELSAVAVAERLQKEYEQTITFVADFKQTTRMEMARRPREAEGTVLFKKPGRVRWDYRLPDRQVIVSDGEVLRMYFEQAQQMIRTSAKAAMQSDVTYAFFAGTGSLTANFDAVAAEAGIEASSGQYVIKLLPKEPHPQVDRLYVWVDGNNFIMVRLRIVDLFGSVTDLFFENIERNVTLADDLFAFEPPPGTEIIEQ